MNKESDVDSLGKSRGVGGREILAEAVRSLDLAVLTPTQSDGEGAYQSFDIIGEAPGWWDGWLGGAHTIFERSPFLEGFISGEAGDYWKNPESEGVVRSGLWEETSEDVPAGETSGKTPRFFEATASRASSGTALLLIAPADERLERERDFVQKTHELNLNRRWLQKELEKKQILLECITHDLGNPLATVLLNLQHVAGQVKDEPQLLTPIERAIGQTKRQASLVRSISEVFASDLSSMRFPNADGSEFPDLVAVTA